MSRNIASIFGKASRQPVSWNPVQWPLPNCLTGLEIEVETTPNSVMPSSFFPYWNRIKDGSLRNGHEYVLAMPLKGDALAQAIHELFAEPTRFERSATGSTHIHLDMFEEGVVQDTIKMMVLLMYTFESAIFAIADRGREWCGYTNKLTSAPDVVVGAVLNASEDDNYMEFAALCQDRLGHQQLGRYYGINVMALAKYGSLEFRYFPTATSPEELIDWITLCQNFKLAAMQLGTVERFIEVLESEELYDEFLTTYFSKWKDVFMQELPQIIAVSNMRKALAVASTQALNRGVNAADEFDEKAVTSNKMFAKFLKNKVKSGVLPILMIGPSQLAPDSRTKTAGTVMIHSGRVYIAAFDSWSQAPYSGDDLPYGNRFGDVHRRKALASLRKHMMSVSNMAMNAGYGPTTCIQIVARIQQAILYLERALNVDHVPVEAEPVRVEAASGRPTMPRGFTEHSYFADPAARAAIVEEVLPAAELDEDADESEYEEIDPEDMEGDDL